MEDPSGATIRRDDAARRRGRVGLARSRQNKSQSGMTI